NLTRQGAASRLRWLQPRDATQRCQQRCLVSLEEKNMIDVRRQLELPSGRSGTYFSLPALEQGGIANVSRLPVSIRIMLESVLRNLDGRRIRDEDVLALANWQPHAPRTSEVPFAVGRVLLQDFTGVPLLVDLAA